MNIPLKTRSSIGALGAVAHVNDKLIMSKNKVKEDTPLHLTDKGKAALERYVLLQTGRVNAKLGWETFGAAVWMLAAEEMAKQFPQEVAAILTCTIAMTEPDFFDYCFQEH